MDMPIREDAKAILRQFWKARFLDDTLILICRTIPSDLGLHRDMSRIEGIAIIPNVSARRTVKERCRVATVKTRKPKRDASADIPGLGIGCRVDRCFASW